MREFWTLFKYEFKLQIPFLKKREKADFLGGMFTLLIVAILIYVSVVFLGKIFQNYLLVQINKTANPIERAKEMLSILYLLVFGVMTILTLERTRRIFADDKNKQVFLRLPLSKRNVFLSKFAVLLLHTFVVGSVFILTINGILQSVFPLGLQFWLSTVAVCIILPIICLLLVSILIVPYILIIELLFNKYSVLFVLFTTILIVSFILYSQLLSVVQTLLTTGSIRFLFNEEFVATLQWIYKNAYPISAMVGILFEQDSLRFWLILLLFVLVSMLIVFLVSKSLYKLTLYRQQKENEKARKPKSVKCRNTIFSLIKKEFICVYREPKHIFAYFSIAMSMPIMVYCSFTLFETLIYNTLGLHINFALALSVVLMFGVLTNTFCSTNITRDGQGILKMKTLPLSVSKIFLAKVLFCAMVSSFAMIASCTLLMIATSLQVVDGLICIAIGLAFTFAQILIATKLDLNHAKLSMGDMEAEAHSGKTLSKVVLIGGLLTLVAGASTVFFALFASGLKMFSDIQLLKTCTYLVPALIGVIYLALSFVYFRVNITKRFENLVN